MLLIKEEQVCRCVCVLINSTGLHFRNSKWQWMRLLLSKSEMKSRNDVEQTRGKRQLIQSGLTWLQSQLLCPKITRWMRTYQKQKQNRGKTARKKRLRWLTPPCAALMSAGCAVALGSMGWGDFCFIDINDIMSYSPTSEPLSLDCSLVLWIKDYDCSLPSPLSHPFIKWL